MDSVFTALGNNIESDLPFMGQKVKLSIQLTHGDGLGVYDVGVDVLIGPAPNGLLPFQSTNGPLQHLIALNDKIRDETLRYIVWLSLMRVTDWLNTVTWLTNISVCCPPQSCRGGTLLDTTKCFHSFHANKWQNELQTCMLTAKDAFDRALAVYCAHSTINTHCTARNLKKIPAGGKKTERKFLQVLQ